MIYQFFYKNILDNFNDLKKISMIMIKNKI